MIRSGFYIFCIYLKEQSLDLCLDFLQIRFMVRLLANRIVTIILWLLGFPIAFLLILPPRLVQAWSWFFPCLEGLFGWWIGRTIDSLLMCEKRSNQLVHIFWFFNCGCCMICKLWRERLRRTFSTTLFSSIVYISATFDLIFTISSALVEKSRTDFSIFHLRLSKSLHKVWSFKAIVFSVHWNSCFKTSEASMEKSFFPKHVTSFFMNSYATLWNFHLLHLVVEASSLSIMSHRSMDSKNAFIWLLQ